MSYKFEEIKIYHIVHIERFKSILEDGCLFCDEKMQQHKPVGPVIGINNIKSRRLAKKLISIPDITVGQCVPFYFCPRSVMLYVISCQNNPDLYYKNGQDDIIHLVFNLKKVLDWANKHNLKVCFTTSNAGSNYFEDYSDFSMLQAKVDWESVNATRWAGDNIERHVKENKQAEFLIEKCLDISLVEEIGVYNLQNYTKVTNMLNATNSKNNPNVIVKQEWYY